jgi:D-alanyl-D-alanine carboxypeptidase (penicillin-binding protein 5/6)
MTFLELAAAALGCLLIGSPIPACVDQQSHVAGIRSQAGPVQTGDALDVVLSAQAALAWDVDTDTVLYSKNPDDERPIASLNKLVAMLAARTLLQPDAIVEIPPEVRAAQRGGADVSLPVGQHISVSQLFAAAAIPSANDAMVTLAIAAKGSEEDFVAYANTFAQQHGLEHTKLANSTGLNGGDQHSTASDVRRMLTMASNDALLGPLLSQSKGTVRTEEGFSKEYKTTDELLGSYLPIIAAKTGYTPQAGENLAIITRTKEGHKIGAVVLGSADRFHDMKVLVEWIERNYTWK